jgi:hypothetical protein
MENSWLRYFSIHALCLEFTRERRFQSQMVKNKELIVDGVFLEYFNVPLEEGK